MVMGKAAGNLDLGLGQPLQYREKRRGWGGGWLMAMGILIDVYISALQTIIYLKIKTCKKL